MAKMLKHRKTGEILPYNPDVARHPDMDIMEDDGSMTGRKRRPPPKKKAAKKRGPVKRKAEDDETQQDTTAATDTVQAEMVDDEEIGLDLSDVDLDDEDV